MLSSGAEIKCTWLSLGCRTDGQGRGYGVRGMLDYIQSVSGENCENFSTHTSIHSLAINLLPQPDKGDAVRVLLLQLLQFILRFMWLCKCERERERGQRESERVSIAIWLALPVKFVCHCSQQFNFNSCAATRVTLKVGGAGQAGGAAG